MSTVIKVENLSKQYRLGLVGATTFKEDSQRWWAKLRGKEDPFLNLGVENDRTVNDNSKFVWSLKDINFDVEQGDVLGIIGRNGAGKSTLLKILSKVTAPTTGSVKVKGRIASLLEVGTGFHPELTGRENIYLNGAILGMRKHEITRKLDEIIVFAGVEKYIDTPVKRYSSGMYVRLAFAVAAHLESEVLIVDEVLAVGDADFQKKCLGKMGDISKSDGRTIIFVSHNMSAVSELCNKGLMLENGILNLNSTSREVVDNYLIKPYNLNTEINLSVDPKSRRGNGDARFVEVCINNNSVNIDPTKDFLIKFKIKLNKFIKKLGFSLLVNGQNNDYIAASPVMLIDENLNLIGDIYSYELKINANTFRTGVFPVYICIFRVDDNPLETYIYDVLDGVYYLNFVSKKTFVELGYDPISPISYVNLNLDINKTNNF
jgi:lipopolysaccharide transport system ATP-binding protein